MATTAVSSSTDTSYNYTRPSATATRSLIDSTKPSPQESGTTTPSDPISPHGTLHRRKTNNYESALADRLSASIASPTTNTSPPITSTTSPDTASSSAVEPGHPPVIHTSLAYRGDAAAAQQPQTGHNPMRPVVSAGVKEQETGPDGRPLLGALGRQQSFKQSDQKRVAMERMLSTEDVTKGRGYTSVPGTPV